MAHNISAKRIQLFNLITGDEASIQPVESDSREGGFTREGDFMLTARNSRDEHIAVRFSEADAYALQDWLNERFPKNVP